MDSTLAQRWGLSGILPFSTWVAIPSQGSTGVLLPLLPREGDRVHWGGGGLLGLQWDFCLHSCNPTTTMPPAEGLPGGPPSVPRRSSHHFIQCSSPTNNSILLMDDMLSSPSPTLMCSLALLGVPVSWVGPSEPGSVSLLDGTSRLPCSCPRRKHPSQRLSIDFSWK